MQEILSYIQILLSILLIITVLLQKSESSLGGAFGGSDSSNKFSRRGFEKVLFNSTIVLAILFVLSAVIALFL
jgi:preprotein translocase subunit SecG